MAANKIKRSKSVHLLCHAYLLLLCVLPHVTSLTTSFVYNFSSPGVLAGADIKYMSNATAGSDRIELTKDTVWSTGRVAYGQPVRLWDDTTGMVASFTSNFTFAIKRRNITSQGDGMAFFVGAYPSVQPQDSNGGFLGLVNNPSNPANTYFPPTVGVEFDAFRNTWDPDNTVDHVGVDVNGIMSEAYTALPDGSFNGTMSAWVRYDAGSRALSVTLAFLDQPRRGTYNVTAAVDLREAGLPQDAAAGFSAATGDYIEHHQILSWSFESTLARLAVVDDGTAGGRTSNNIGLIAGLTSTAGVVVLVLAVAVAALLRRRRHLKEQTRSIDGDMMDHEFGKGTGPRRFTYTQLSQETRGFSDDHKLGEGGFGSVYRGVLPPDQLGLQVAVKRVSKTSRQGRREYISEVTIISRLRHRNLVQLIGWCHEADELLLIYELMTNGSLKSSTTTSRARRAPYPHPDMAGQVQHHPRDGVGASVPSPGVGAVRGAPRHQAQQHDARRVLQRQVWRLRPRQAHRPRATWTRSPWRWSTCCSWGSGVHPDQAARPSIRHAMNVLQLQAPLPDLPLEITAASVACRRDTPRGVTADGDIRRRPARWQPTPQHILLSPPVRRGVHRETVSVNPRSITLPTTVVVDAPARLSKISPHKGFLPSYSLRI